MEEKLKLLKRHPCGDGLLAAGRRTRLVGLPAESASYVNVVPEKNDGKTPDTLTVKDVPVDDFWSVTLYNDKG